MNRSILPALLLVLLAAPASAGVSCWTIDDPDERAYCRATQTGSQGDCTAISDFARRKQCQARTGGSASVCNGITDQWERQKCKDEANRK